MRHIHFIILQFLAISLISVEILAQDNQQPIKIEERDEKYKETNSKQGAQIRTKKQLVIVYKDGTYEKATNSKLNAIFKQVPLAGAEYKRYKSNNVYMASSLPLFGLGFWGFANLINGKDKQKNALIGIAGLASGVSVYEVFEYRKKRNMNRLIAHCNNYWKNNVPQSEIKNMVVPDILRIGSVDRNNIGVGAIWYIAK